MLDVFQMEEIGQLRSPSLCPGGMCATLSVEVETDLAQNSFVHNKGYKFLILR